jgi:hypothetical protein
MDILYILGSGSKWDNNEIKYSLRSLEKHGQNYDRIFITGEKPKFINNKIIYNYQPDKYIGCINHLLKVLWTFQNTDISDDILLNYDDNFFIKNVDISNYPSYYKREMLPDMFTISNRHTKSLLYTKNILLSLGKPIKDFAVHCPIIYNRQKFYDFYEIFKKYIDINNKDFGLSVRIAYLNSLYIVGEYMPDCKIKRNITKKEIELVIKNRSIFSISNNITKGGITEFLQDNFPNKSKWEL